MGHGFRGNRHPIAPDILADETGGWKKKWKNKLPVGLVFPSSYKVGMSNLGFQLVYDLLNRNDDIVCERIFYPHREGPARSVESSRLMTDFPILAASISFEQDYVPFLQMLFLSGIPPLAEERASDAAGGNRLFAPGRPLVIAGGVATFMNPEPLAPFVDLFLIGEAEPVLPDVMRKILEYQHHSREEVLQILARRSPGCYVPALYDPQYASENGRFSGFSHSPDLDLPRRIKKITLENTGDTVGHSKILTPHAEFANLFMAELGRGCSRGCRFCAAGFIYRPPRLWPADKIISALAARPESVARVGLLGMEMANSSDLAMISEELLNQGCALSFSSLRADVITPSLLKVLGRSALKSAAIAPDGGSERLRRVINKGITADDVLRGAEALVQAGIYNLKLYFMIGLPTESIDDLEEMVALVLQVKEKILACGRSRGRLSDISLSINSFIPKPWTPFQYHPFSPVRELKEKLKFLRKQLAGVANLTLTSERPEKTLHQAVLARGDRRLGHALLHLAADKIPWRQALEREGLASEEYANRQRDQGEPFPWEIIDHGINRDYLWQEYQKALAARTTIPCDTSLCRRCGVCNDPS